MQDSLSKIGLSSTYIAICCHDQNYSNIVAYSPMIIGDLWFTLLLHNCIIIIYIMVMIQKDEHKHRSLEGKISSMTNLKINWKGVKVM